MKKVELLAPAGDYESFAGAICAGADAVYLAGAQFGARAYAKNFTEEEVVRAIRYAHLFGRKVYLTVNILMKEAELAQLYDYLLPYYISGLDAVIVQDLGAASLIRRCFPDMELHISTQMTVTGAYGAKLMKQLGASRVVPARELSLTEIKKLKEQAGLEVEVFVHGALCYCYSGQCLFSSMLGGRSGNRGRCAQPCRLPYGQEGMYPLSLKDLCALQRLPELIEAGVDSLKIEGRMKKPEYAAGVTAIYRKYIDRYYAAPEKQLRIEAGDFKDLQELYVRSGLQDGYLSRYNGREMITLKQPGYVGSSERLLEDIRREYLETALTAGIIGRAVLKKGERASFTVYAPYHESVSVTVTGELVQQSEKQPLEIENVKKQLSKTGGTPFVMEELEIDLETDVFLPVKALNGLRRKALSRLEEALSGTRQPEEAAVRAGAPAGADRMVMPGAWEEEATREKGGTPRLYASVHSMEQLEAVLSVKALAGVYVPAGLCLTEGVPECVLKIKQQKPSFSFCLSMPYILRDQSFFLQEEAADGTVRTVVLSEKEYLRKLEALMKEEYVDGILARNYETLAWLQETGFQKLVVTDANLYIWNQEAASCLERLTCRYREAYQEGPVLREPAACVRGGVRMTLPVELERKLLRKLAGSGKELIVYGRANMMVTANCVRKTMSRCLMNTKRNGREYGPGFDQLRDRYQKIFPVETNCLYCYNVIYNSVPTSLHQEIGHIREWGLDGIRLQFITESGKESGLITQYFADLLAGKEAGRPPYEEYTRGHIQKGAM